MSQERQESQNNRTSGFANKAKARQRTSPSPEELLGDLDKASENANNEPKDVNVMSGSSQKKLPMAGLTVGKIRKKLKVAFNIHDEAVALIDGKEAAEDTVLKYNQDLQFIRPVGTKG